MAEDMRTLVWEEMFNADMRHRYFGRLAARSRQIDNTIHIGSLTFSGATFSSAIGWLWPSTAPWFALIALALAAAAAVMRLGSRTTSFMEFSVAWGQLHDEYKLLWIDLNSGGATLDDVQRHSQQLRDRANLIDRQSTHYRINSKLLRTCYDEAAKMVAS